MSEWKTIDTAPKDEVILASDGEWVEFISYRKRDGWYFAWDEYNRAGKQHPTHWMDIPEPPCSPDCSR